MTLLEQQIKPVTEQNISSPRNSPLRDLARVPIEGTVDVLRREFPGLTANHVTIMGPVGGAFSSVLSYVGEMNHGPFRRIIKGTGALGHLTSALTDAIDGPLARRIKAETRTMKIAMGLSSDEENDNTGALFDVTSDRAQETIHSLTHVIMAHKQRRRIAEIAAYAATVSNPLPSLVRAAAETRGVVVNEAGNNLLGFLGTRAGRTITGIAATICPDIKGIDAQLILDSLTACANSYTAITRTYDALTKPATLSEDERKKSLERAQVLAVVTGAILGATFLTHQLLKRQDAAAAKEAVPDGVLNEHYRHTIMQLEQGGVITFMALIALLGGFFLILLNRIVMAIILLLILT